MRDQKQNRNIAIDGLIKKRPRFFVVDYSLANFVLRHKRSSTLYSRNKITRDFFTADSKRYYGQNELEGLRRGEKIRFEYATFDSLTSKSYRGITGESFVSSSRKARRDAYRDIQGRYSIVKNYLEDLFSGAVQGVSVSRMWNLSIVSALIFGMFLMTMIYRYLGQGALARTKEAARVEKIQSESMLAEETEGVVAGDSVEKSSEEDEYTAKIIAEYQAKRKAGIDAGNFEDEIGGMVKGYPIEKMVPYIAKKNKIVAAFLIGIAKKESNWGKRVPVYEGKDCYNYWGFRGKREKMGTGGHTCFNSREDAVDTVAKRLEFLISDEKVDTPGKMVTVWKCGYDCSWDSPAAVKKWVADVDMYFEKFNKLGKL